MFMKDSIEARLKRIEGQIVGIRKMYSQKRDCMEIAQQIGAVRSALSGVGKKILSGEAVRCARSKDQGEKFEKVVKQLFDLS